MTREINLNLDSMLTGYLECALWTIDTDQESAAEALTIFDFDGDTRDRAYYICEQFAEQHAEALERYYEKTGCTEPDAGHDLWLTRNGHGAGFWDRVTGDDFPELCDAADALGRAYVYVTDCGSAVYIEEC